MAFSPKRRYYYEEFAVILSYNIPQRFVKEKRISYYLGVREVYSQALGKDYFTLLELVSDPGIVLQKGEMVYVGRGSPKIKRISARLIFEELVEEAKVEIDNAIRKIVKEDEKRFVDFFNNSGPLSPRVHALEMLPRIGKKTVEKILYERMKSPFVNYEDIKKRAGVSNLEEILFERIRTEITSKEKLSFYLFAKGIQNTLEERAGI